MNFIRSKLGWKVINIARIHHRVKLQNSIDIRYPVGPLEAFRANMDSLLLYILVVIFDGS